MKIKLSIHFASVVKIRLHSVPAIISSTELYQNCNQRNPCKSKETGCRRCRPVAGENDLFNKNSSKVSCANGLRINAELLICLNLLSKTYTDIEKLRYKHGE